ncbi:MAG TPA: hypothetical protein VFT72_17015 [Opitutaceae bacterium]|nr:hypothetical protein [Opitutaceae bacterium]
MNPSSTIADFPPEFSQRALRRHHRARLIARHRRHFGRVLTGEEAAKAATTPTPCSCWMCGSPRRHFGRPTIQEIRATLAD